MKKVKRNLTILIKYYLLLTLIFTPYYLYRISIFKSSSCFEIFLKLNEYNMKIRLINKFNRLILKDIKYSNHPPLALRLMDYFSIFFYTNKPHLIIKKNYNVEFRFSIFLKNYYEYETYDILACECRSKNKSYTLKKIYEWRQKQIKVIDDFINNNENVEISSISSYFIKLKYLLNLTLPFDNPFWHLQELPHISPTTFLIVIFIAIYNIIGQTISIPYLPIFLLIPKNLTITLIFYWIWFISILIFTILIWKKVKFKNII
jgi:hypothetical protein